ncbi:MAG: cytochrome C [Parvularculaceae bacterium]
MMIAAAIAALLADAATAPIPGVANDARARMNWMLHCQGCHQAEAKGSVAARTPAMAGEVARFLSVEGGRAYLTRVPGVANAGLPDDQLAELLNWTLATFDAAHMPATFTPFTAAEVAAGRKAPLVSDAARLREEISARFAKAARSGGGG